ncbi:hypothetical protein DSM106972_010610 [Dulcicalothrix desertica PCC 7102]|uniref:DUF2281 domain-containing protein n=1 Tax=Dulcicalothrix desertica PCC 7102 TaxID=232991 RepID=A0A3S1CTC8_9CYAN|nr:DUF2281 domain-containing protein [Dulcicalothrix desertica]RUT09008.1 hypothetical protein DSM106972_010610 [Dulcicalothrix desertica PCC 7102]TWH49892.1 uncharacterized protein DUF2281 [Dulcicalothrix desertica PCC 7102]
MTLHEQTVSKLQELPESLVKEVSDYIDYLLWKHDSQNSFSSQESLELVNSDFSNYLSNLEDYENRLVRGEIKW